MILKNVIIAEELAEDMTTVSMLVPEKLDQDAQVMIDSHLRLELLIAADGRYGFSIIDISKKNTDGITISRVLLDRIEDSMDTLEMYLRTKYGHVLNITD